MMFAGPVCEETQKTQEDEMIPPIKITKSVGVVFVDCDKCNPNCPLQQQLKAYKNVTVWKPFGITKEYMLRSYGLMDINKIADMANKLYDLTQKICYNCTERQR